MDTAGIASNGTKGAKTVEVEPRRWWQHGVIYQIYPRSFADSNGDGIGDLPGIIQRLDYLQWLGVDAMWLSPIYPSPMVDFGYDVSDYTNIHPIFGTLDDLDRLLDAAHRRGLRVILDFVPNHTSDQHPWFLESRSSRGNPKRDWYIWRDPGPDGGPPNNWLSTFGGSAWEWDAKTQQYYYHAYLTAQPDLNWRHPEVQEAMHDVMRFWLNRGVDGFRIDVIWHMVKDDQFRCNPPNPDYRPGEWPYRQLLATYTTDRPEVHDIIAGMRRVMDAYDDRMMVGEIYLPIERLVTYYGTGGSGVHLPFNFHLIELPWHAPTIASMIDAYEAALPLTGWPNWVLSNHDKPRIATRIGHAQARVAAMLLLSLRGTPTLYYGDEVGMANVVIAPDLVQDPWEKNEPGQGLGRDPARTPMQWDGTSNAGFTRGTPWLPVANDYAVKNVANERENPTSMLTLYRRLIALRRREAALSVGRYRGIQADGEVISYVREEGERRFLVVLNLLSRPQSVSIKSMRSHGRLVLSTYLDREDEAIDDTIMLRADEGIIVDLSQV
jgi:alpha-glucosidase